MRPIKRGPSPINKDYTDYNLAKPDLVSRLGSYCSYCERKIATQLAVEHIQPKAEDRHPQLIGRWTNFLLACVNCNSSRGTYDVDLSKVLLPDRDNTFLAFSYTPDGVIEINDKLSSAVQEVAAETLRLTGLDKKPDQVHDENGKLVALDRQQQRVEIWQQAEMAKSMIDSQPQNEILRVFAANLAKATGFFSVWMKIFVDNRDMKARLVAIFPGTTESGCFEQDAMSPISPAPNPDGLEFGGKILGASLLS